MGKLWQELYICCSPVLRWLYFPPFFILLGLLPALLAYRTMDARERPPLWAHGSRWFLGLVFAFSGLAKLLPGFPNTIGPVHLESLLAPHGLALFARFIAVMEVAAGFLLLTRRLATLGELTLLPMLATILVITISLQWKGTPYVNAVFLIMNLALVIYDWPKISPLIGERPRPGEPLATRGTSRASLYWLFVMGLLLMALGGIRMDAPKPGSIALVAAIGAGFLVAEWRSSAGSRN